MDAAKDPLVCQTEWSTMLSRWIGAPVFLLVALALLWSGLTDHLPPAERLFVWAWIASAVWIGVTVLLRSATRIQVDEAGVCTFRAPLRAVATCTLAEVTDVRMPVNGRTLRLQAAGRKVAVVLPMNGVATFLARVKAAHAPDDSALGATDEPLVCRTDARALRFQAIASSVFVVVAPFVLWSWSNASHSNTYRLFGVAWIGFAIWIFWATFARKVIRIDVDQAGTCTFRARTRVVATCTLADVSEIRLLGDGRTLRLRAQGRKLSALLPMDGIEMFVSSVRDANPGLAVDGF
jgi:hypothetical protein